jgi:hypothetical protein
VLYYNSTSFYFVFFSLRLFNNCYFSAGNLGDAIKPPSLCFISYSSTLLLLLNELGLFSFYCASTVL